MVENKQKDAPKAGDAEKEASAKEKPLHENCEGKIAEYRDSLLRLQAEFENYKKRCEKENMQFRQFAAAETVKGLLPVLDSFELALKSMGGDEIVVKGMEMIYGQFFSALESQGLRPIRAVGEKFDPYRHEVLLQEETAEEKKDGVIVEEFQRGYLFHDAVLRCSKVKVFKFSVRGENKNGK